MRPFLAALLTLAACQCLPGAETDPVPQPPVTAGPQPVASAEPDPVAEMPELVARNALDLRLALASSTQEHARAVWQLMVDHPEAWMREVALRAVNGDDDFIVGAALEVLKAQPPIVESLGPVRRLLASPNSSIQTRAMAVAVASHDHESVPLIIAMMKATPREDLKEIAADALRRLTNQPHGAEPEVWDKWYVDEDHHIQSMLESLRKSVEAENIPSVYQCIRDLSTSTIDIDQISEQLLPLTTTHLDEGVRSLARSTLAAMGVDASSVEPPGDDPEETATTRTAEAKAQPPAAAATAPGRVAKKKTAARPTGVPRSSSANMDENEERTSGRSPTWIALIVIVLLLGWLGIRTTRPRAADTSTITTTPRISWADGVAPSRPGVTAGGGSVMKPPPRNVPSRIPTPTPVRNDAKPRRPKVFVLDEPPRRKS